VHRLPTPGITSRLGLERGQPFGHLRAHAQRGGPDESDIKTERRLPEGQRLLRLQGPLPCAFGALDSHAPLPECYCYRVGGAGVVAGSISRQLPAVQLGREAEPMRLHGPYAFLGLIVAVLIVYLALRLAGLI
jgi:hypothetical protein